MAVPHPFWDVIREAAHRNKDGGYADQISELSPEVYRERVRRIGFTGLETVLDLGCGFGQWTWALAEQNRRVVAMEINAPRLAVTREFTASKDQENVDFVRANGVKLPFADGAFKAVFCYGVFMFMPPVPARDEIARVLAPGGRAYLCTNGPGWWASLYLKHLRGLPSVRNAARSAFRNGTDGGVPSSISARDASRMFPAPQWRVVEAGAEGRLGGGGRGLRAYPAKFLWFDNVIDLLVEKQA